MSRIAYADPGAPRPTLSGARSDGSAAERTVEAAKARMAAAAPLAISVAVQWVFFIQYWIPETGAAPARDWWLTQLHPLSATLLTSQGSALVPAQAGRWGIPGLVLLLAGFLLYWASRTPHWLGRRAMAAPVLLGLIASLTIVVSLSVAGTLHESAISVVLLLAWLCAAGYAALNGVLERLGPTPPKRWHSGLPLLAAYALLAPAPTAVGRWLFAPELRDIAAGMQGNAGTLRLAALWTGGTALLYLCGLLVGVTCWIAYHWWPPRRELRSAVLSLGIVLMLIVIGILGWPASTIAARRVTHLMYQSPTTEVTFTCGFRPLAPPPATRRTQPALTLVLSGFHCTKVRVFSGYRQLALWTVHGSAAPVRARTPDGDAIATRTVAAGYGDVVVLATTSRMDGRADRLTALRYSDGAQPWELACTASDFGIRFASVPTGDDPASGYLTRSELGPTVVVRCAGNLQSFDPAAGPPR